jgi:predicted membrane-bound dolichyl-phosphate-mannose-protein mannosyltransferase
VGKLADLALPTEEINVGSGQTITVRGLSFLDVSTLFRDHAATLDKLYREHVVENREMPPADQVAKAILTESPDLVAHIIARANDEPESHPLVTRLPGITQINALLTIARLTFHSEDEMGKVLETVIEGAGVLSNLLGTVRTQGLPSQ